MATPKRIYLVISPDGIERLVNATSPSAAINHIARPGFSATAASPTEVARIMTHGGKVIEAGETEASPELDEIDLI